jgi:hypothetical protein
MRLLHRAPAYGFVGRERKLRTPHETALYLKVSARTLKRWRGAGTGPKYIKAGRRILYADDHLSEWEEENTHRSTSDVQD